MKEIPNMETTLPTIICDDLNKKDPSAAVCGDRSSVVEGVLCNKMLDQQQNGYQQNQERFVEHSQMLFIHKLNRNIHHMLGCLFSFVLS